MSLQDSSLLTWSTISTVVVAYCTLAAIYHFTHANRPPTSIPWMSYGQGWIASFRNFTAILKTREWVLAGYEKYSKNNRAFVLPGTMGVKAEVVLPRSHLNWMFDQPDHILSTSEAQYDTLYGNYSFISPDILRDPYHAHVIHKNLVRNLNTIIPEIEDEVPFAIAAVYGTDTQNWKRLESLHSFMEIVPVLTNRMLVGPLLCRERAFLKAALGFTEDVIRNSALLSLIPKPLLGAVGPIFGLANRWHFRQSSTFTLPLIKKRISDLERKAAGDPEYVDWNPPNDFVTWSYLTAMAEGRLDEADPDRIALRLLPINFAAIHTTSLTAYETLTSILSADASVVELLREEAHRVFQEEGRWTRQGLNKLYRIDSTIRESQRTSPIALTFVHRKVIAKEGIIIPEGVHIPCGTVLSCPWTPMAGDQDIYADPDKFDAFRFSRPREEYEAMSEEQKIHVDTLKLKQIGAVTTAHNHLPFGHGRHACPGRFFVTQELKMILAHLLLNYDFKPLAERPKKLWMARFQIPQPAYVEFRRRKEPWAPGAKI